MAKQYTVFNLYGGHVQLPSGAYLAARGNKEGRDRSFPVEIPEGHALWRWEQPDDGRDPMVWIKEGDHTQNPPEEYLKLLKPLQKMDIAKEPPKPGEVKAPEPPPPVPKPAPEPAPEPEPEPEPEPVKEEEPTPLPVAKPDKEKSGLSDLDGVMASLAEETTPEAPPAETPKSKRGRRRKK